MSKIYVVGGANIDLFAYSQNKFILKDSNPCLIEMSFGGVARNIADNLSYLNVPVSFITSFSKDHFSNEIINDLKQKGVDLSYCKIDDTNTSGIYMAFIGQDRDLHLGASCNNALDNFNINDVKFLSDLINDDDYLVFDTNLNQEVIKYICNNVKGIKVCDAISSTKAKKLTSDVLKHIDVLKVNKLEASKLLNVNLDLCNDISKLALDLCMNQNIGQVIITTNDGCYISDRSEKKSYYYSHDHLGVNVLNTTGAGDCFLATYTWAKFNNMPLDLCAAYALASSYLTVCKKDTVAKNTIEDIKTCLKTIKIKGGIKNVY